MTDSRRAPEDPAAGRRPLRIGLAANRLHHANPDSDLFRLLREAEPALRDCLKPTIFAVGRTFDAIRSNGLLEDYPGLVRYPFGREGGLMRLVARVVDPDPGQAIDAAIYLIDPVDPSSTFPEAVALKRQCVIHGKPFVSTLLGAREWLELKAVEAGNEPNPALDPVFDFGAQSIALVAHDARKTEMIDLVREHFDFFDRFASRVATGTTGGLLNALAAEMRPGRRDQWVRALRSGPMGGDAQIAELLLDGACQRVLFLEDPHVARQHEADIQLLERAARTVGDRVACLADLASARAWIADCRKRLR